MLYLEAPDAELADRFLSGEQSLMRAEPLFERWSRAVQLGVSAESDARPQITSDTDLALRRERFAEVFREKRVLLTPLSQHLAKQSIVAVVADPDGVIVTSHGARAFEDAVSRVHVVEGARWSEDVRGTNGIGTAIAERRPVAVIGAAHFERRNHGIFCYGHPIIDGYGDLVAVLDVTGPLERHDREIGNAVRAAAVSLEQALRRLAYAQSGAGTLSAIERLVHRSSASTLLIEASGRVAVVNEHAASMLGINDPAGMTSKRLFGLSFDELRRLVVSGLPDMRFETSGGTYRVELDPINAAAGRTIAIVIHLEPVRIRTKRRSDPPGIDRAVPAAPSSVSKTRVAIVNDAIIEAVKASAGNVSEAARRLGIARSTVYRVLRGRRDA